jgi:hypothetical protein
MSKKAEIAALRERVKDLEAEVAALRTIPWWQRTGGGMACGWPQAAPQCSCGTSRRCMKHYPSDWSTIWVNSQNTCGAAPVPQVITVNPPDGPLTFTRDFINVAAGCAAPAQTFTVNV